VCVRVCMCVCVVIGLYITAIELVSFFAHPARLYHNLLTKRNEFFRFLLKHFKAHGAHFSHFSHFPLFNKFESCWIMKNEDK